MLDLWIHSIPFTKPTIFVCVVSFVCIVSRLERNIAHCQISAEGSDWNRSIEGGLSQALFGRFPRNSCGGAGEVSGVNVACGNAPVRLTIETSQEPPTQSAPLYSAVIVSVFVIVEVLSKTSQPVVANVELWDK